MNPLVLAWIRLILYTACAGMLSYIALTQHGIKRRKNFTAAFYFLSLVMVLSGRVFVSLELQTLIADWLLTPTLVLYTVALAIDLIVSSRMHRRRRDDVQDNNHKGE